MRAALAIVVALGASACFDAHDRGAGERDGAGHDAAAPRADAAHVIGGERCEDAAPLEPGDYLGDTSGMVDELRAGSLDTCDNMSGYGADAVFRVTVPSATRLTVGVQPLAAFDSIVLLASRLQCETDLPDCLTGNDAGGVGDADVTSWVNVGATTEAYVVVDGFDSTSEGPFALHLGLAPMERGETCTDPIRLASGDVRVTFQTTTGFRDDPISCSGPGHDLGANDVYYALEVPAGATLDVAVTPVPSVDVRLVVIDPAFGGVCSVSPVCSTAVDGDGPGGPELVNVAAQPAARTVFLGVEQGDDQPRRGAFTIEVGQR